MSVEVTLNGRTMSVSVMDLVCDYLRGQGLDHSAAAVRDEMTGRTGSHSTSNSVLEQLITSSRQVKPKAGGTSGPTSPTGANAPAAADEGQTEGQNKRRRNRKKKGGQDESDVGANQESAPSQPQQQQQQQQHAKPQHVATHAPGGANAQGSAATEAEDSAAKNKRKRGGKKERERRERKERREAEEAAAGGNGGEEALAGMAPPPDQPSPAGKGMARQKKDAQLENSAKKDKKKHQGASARGGDHNEAVDDSEAVTDALAALSVSIQNEAATGAGKGVVAASGGDKQQQQQDDEGDSDGKKKKKKKNRGNRGGNGAADGSGGGGEHGQQAGGPGFGGKKNQAGGGKGKAAGGGSGDKNGKWFPPPIPLGDDGLPVPDSRPVHHPSRVLEEGDVDEWRDDDDYGYRVATVEEEEIAELLLPGWEYDEGEAHQTISYAADPPPPEEDEHVSFALNVFYKPNKTGFEETKDFPIVSGERIAGRYEMVRFLGAAAFSTAVECIDLHTDEQVCVKIIKNNKDFFDQSMDEIKLLMFLNTACDPEEANLVGLRDFFYFKEHLFIVCELLGLNLYEFQKEVTEAGHPNYFTLPRLQYITKQLLTTFVHVHDLGLIHCDLKPENILMKSYSRCLVKTIDFGSSCFVHDNLSCYVQSRSYRAPEVVLGLPYDVSVDMWSLGCILPEMLTGYVLFHNDSVQTLMARWMSVLGDIPEDMKQKGKLKHKFFTSEGQLFECQPPPGEDEDEDEDQLDEDGNPKPPGAGRGPGGEGGAPPVGDGVPKFNLLYPKKSSLQHRCHTDDELFLDFVQKLLSYDPKDRPTAREALHHPWLTEAVYDEPLAYEHPEMPEPEEEDIDGVFDQDEAALESEDM